MKTRIELIISLGNKVDLRCFEDKQHVIMIGLLSLKGKREGRSFFCDHQELQPLLVSNTASSRFTDKKS